MRMKEHIVEMYYKKFWEDKGKVSNYHDENLRMNIEGLVASMGEYAKEKLLFFKINLTHRGNYGENYDNHTIHIIDSHFTPEVRLS